MASGFVVLVWVGAAVMAFILLQGRTVHGTASRLLASLLIGQAAGLVLQLLLVAHGWTLAIDLAIELALAAWLVWRPGMIVLAVVIVFEALGLFSEYRLLQTPLSGAAGLLAAIAWRGAIIACALVAAVRPRRLD